MWCGVASPLRCGVPIEVWLCCLGMVMWWCYSGLVFLFVFCIVVCVGFIVDDVVAGLRNNAAAELFRRFHYWIPLFFNCCALKSLSPNLLSLL